MPRWEPVLEGELAADAWRAVHELAADMPSDVPPERAADLTLWWAYAAGALDDPACDARYDAATEALVARIGGGQSRLGLHGGLAGAGWALAHVSDGGADEVLAAIDEVVSEAVSADPWQGHFDLIMGLAGLAVYLLERIATSSAPLPVVHAAIERVVAHLDALAIADGDGVAWQTRPELVATAPARAAGDFFDAGTAHGTPGVVAVLARISALRDPPPRAAELCARGLAWMGAPRRLDAARATTAWCYGDPGAATAAWGAAIRTGAPVAPWHERAVDAAARPASRGEVDVPGLCHGALGVAHLFNRCYQASGDARLRDAARRWFAHGLSLRRPGTGIAGFAVPRRGPDGELGWIGSSDFIEGAAGIGLALLAGLGSEEPGWDRLLGCDAPPGDHRARGRGIR